MRKWSSIRILIVLLCLLFFYLNRKELWYVFVISGRCEKKNLERISSNDCELLNQLWNGIVTCANSKNFLLLVKSWLSKQFPLSTDEIFSDRILFKSEISHWIDLQSRVEVRREQVVPSGLKNDRTWMQSPQSVPREQNVPSSFPSFDLFVILERECTSNPKWYASYCKGLLELVW